MLQTKFGEKVGTDSEDFFATISQFLIQFNKVVQEKLSSVSGPRLVDATINLVLVYSV